MIDIDMRMCVRTSCALELIRVILTEAMIFYDV